MFLKASLASIVLVGLVAGQPHGFPQQSPFAGLPQFNASAGSQQCEPASQTSVHHVCLLACDCLCNNVRGSVWFELCYSPCVELVISNRATCYVSNSIAVSTLQPYRNCPLGTSGNLVCQKACACCGDSSRDCIGTCTHGLLAYLTLNECQKANALLSG